MDPSAELPLSWVVRWLVGVHPVLLLLAPTGKGTASPGNALQTGDEWINLTGSQGWGSCAHIALGEQKETLLIQWFSAKK